MALNLDVSDLFVFFLFFFFQYRGTPSVMSKNYGAAGTTSRRGQAYVSVQRAGNLKGSSPRPSVKAAVANEHTAVTLDDIKSVALDSMPEVDDRPSAFQECYRCNIIVQLCHL